MQHGKRLRAVTAMVLMLSTLVVSIYASSDVQAASRAGAAQALPASTAKQAAFHDAMRKLWEDHITWTRLFIVDAVAGSPETSSTAERLLRNQTDIGDAIKPFYGDAAGAQLTALLRDHILTAAEILTAAKAGDAAKVTDANARWYANADQIAAFLHTANPDHWPLADMQTMMRTHLNLTLEEAVAHINGDWATDIAAYDSVHLEILEMADMLSDGIIQQFPAKFE